MKKFLNGFLCFRDAIYFRLDYNDEVDRLAFFEEICYGWRAMYFGDFDD
jgi:hypothetical protein